MEEGLYLSVGTLPNASANVVSSSNTVMGAHSPELVQADKNAVKLN